MKILRIAFENIGIFDGSVSIDLTAQDRITEDGQVQKQFGTISSQKCYWNSGPKRIREKPPC